MPNLNTKKLIALCKTAGHYWMRAGIFASVAVRPEQRPEANDSCLRCGKMRSAKALAKAQKEFDEAHPPKAAT
jgi:hypothetical protein